MTNTVISVENLSKCYLIGHRSAERERYTALRDVIGREARNFLRKASDLLQGKEIVQGDEVQEFWALKDVGFEIKQGEVLGIIGRNGAGKTTLLKILSRITEPTSGRVKLKGRVASLLEVGTGFHPELTGRENIFLNGAVLGMKKAEIRLKFDEIVAFSGVEHFLDTPVKRFSSGMYVRLAFAVAAHLEPDILIVDEVLAVGDADFQKKCLGKMHDVATKQGRTVLFVSHNMAAVESMCDRALLLVQGRCVALGKTSAVMQEYLRDLDRVSVIPLDERADREGTGDFRVLSVSLESDGAPVSTFRCGAEATLHLVIENRTSRELRNIHISVGIDNEIGQRVAILDTELIGPGIPSITPGTESVSFIIPKMPLIPGRYRLTLWSEVSRGIADYIKNAATFDVELGDFYGTGRLPQPGQGQGMFHPDFCFVSGRPNDIDRGAPRLAQKR